MDREAWKQREEDPNEAMNGRNGEDRTKGDEGTGPWLAASEVGAATGRGRGSTIGRRHDVRVGPLSERPATPQVRLRWRRAAPLHKGAPCLPTARAGLKGDVGNRGSREPAAEPLTRGAEPPAQPSCAVRWEAAGEGSGSSSARSAHRMRGAGTGAGEGSGATAGAGGAVGEGGADGRPAQRPKGAAQRLGRGSGGDVHRRRVVAIAIARARRRPLCSPSS